VTTTPARPSRKIFKAEGIAYYSSHLSKTEIYEAFEPVLNAGEVELPDIPKLTEQLLCLVVRGARIDHQAGDHDDWANACCGAVAQLDSKNQDWSGARGFFEHMRRTNGAGLNCWMPGERSESDKPQPIQKEWAIGSVEHGLQMQGLIGPPT